MTIVANSLSKEYAKKQGGKLALSDLTLTVAAGEALALLGPNGAGKSTLMKILSTLVRPDSGAASITGLDVVNQSAAVRGVIGVALQDVALYPAAKVRQILVLHARLCGLNRAAAARRGDEIIELAGLEQVVGQRINRLSGGMRRRVDLGLALVHQPPVLLLDEPTNGLDPFSRVEFWRELGQLRDQGTCILFASQSIEEAEQLADRVAILTAGSLWRDDTPASVLREIWSGNGAAVAG